MLRQLERISVSERDLEGAKPALMLKPPLSRTKALEGGAEGHEQMPWRFEPWRCYWSGDIIIVVFNSSDLVARLVGMITANAVEGVAQLRGRHGMNF